MWELYDTLIDGIPDNIKVEDFSEGPHWVALGSDEGGVGLAMKIDVRSRPPVLREFYRGMPLKEAASASKSWNFAEAAFGIAAMNAFYNHPARAEKLGLDLNAPSKKHEAFVEYRRAVMGKKVVVVGHFPYLERELGPVCDLSILERNPWEGDFPDSACEFILGDQDYVFITGVTLVNKTLPRLLQLARNAYIVMVGPSVTLAPALLKMGVNDLSGFVVLNNKLSLEFVKNGHMKDNFHTGTMVNLRATPPSRWRIRLEENRKMNYPLTAKFVKNPEYAGAEFAAQG